MPTLQPGTHRSDTTIELSALIPTVLHIHSTYGPYRAYGEHTETIQRAYAVHTIRALTRQYPSVLWFYSPQLQPVRLPERHLSPALLVGPPPPQQRPCCPRTRTASSSAWQQRRKMTCLRCFQYCGYARSRCATHHLVEQGVPKGHSRHFIQ